MPAEQYSFERYLNARMAFGASFSPDGQRLTFLTNITGVAEVWSVPVDMATNPSWPEQLTFVGDRVGSASYSPVADTLLVSADVGGSEHMQLYLLSGDGANFTALTARPESIYQFGDWSPDGKRFTYSSNERDARYFDVYERTLATGQTRLLLQQDGTNNVVSYSRDGRYALVSRLHSNIHSQLFLLDVLSGESRPLTSDVFEGQALYSFPSWSADGFGLYLVSNHGRQFFSLAWLDLATSEMTYLRDDQWDVQILALSPGGKHMALALNVEGYSTLELFDVAQGWEARRALPAPTLPQGVIVEAGWSQDGERLAITCMSATNTADIFIW